jgi:predicted enzyme related to lactoylglutathione lyase
MSDKAPQVGTVGWIDLTVADAPRVRDFYQQVIGWISKPIDMGGYDDFNMLAPSSGNPEEDGTPVSGVCHARGLNAALPPQWIVYFIVADLDESLAHCGTYGGRVVAKPRSSPGQGRYAVIADPSGAVCALFEPANAGSA